MTIAILYNILNTVLRILGCQRTIIVTASKILSDFINTQCISISQIISHFHFCKALNYNENIMIFVRSPLFYGFIPRFRL